MGGHLLVDKPLVCQRGITRPLVFAPRCANACAVFRSCAPPSPSAARCSGAADAFWACPRASSRFAAFACALRVLAPPAASRPPTASDRDGNAFLRFAPPCASLARCSGAADALWACPRAFSPSGLHLFASICSAKNARNDVHAVISDLSLVLPILCQGSDCGPPQTRRPTMLYSNSKIAAKNKLSPRFHRSFSSIF